MQIRKRGERHTAAGESYLRDPRVARIVADAITHFDEEHYLLHAWCVMLNHTVRDRDPVDRIVRDVLENPLKAGLHAWPFVRSDPDRY